jgi:hypothetical protein
LSGLPRRWLWLLLVPSVVGGLVGGLLLVRTGDRNLVSKRAAIQTAASLATYKYKEI